MTKTLVGAPDEQPRKKTGPKLRDGVIKRGNSWYYVIRVKDPETGLSRPRWVGGFTTEDKAKEARDEARVKARRGEYVDRDEITVAEFLDMWIEDHAMEIKPGTLEDYKAGIRLYIKPYIGKMRLQAVRPATITKLYRDLSTKGRQDGKPLKASTVTHTHAILRRAFRDAVVVHEYLSSSPVEKAKRPRSEIKPPGTIWTAAQLRTFLMHAKRHRLFAFLHVGECKNNGVTPDHGGHP
ncbi:N-terminal phage integrase SAM-like domain-containing protein [Nonomuraea ceibae]|uniref:N-terminal phage integrase SAM-like domain-containing protein n=1 Tax=Nonomuraea ceibae TaxID=1935170 RepID=UPI001FE8CE7D|nr:N-terminal phage integrase SAM-like domain-containing protein [Nonomuraea ceibae]